jgi:hypothetical protein
MARTNAGATAKAGSGLLISASEKSYQLGSRVAYAQSERMRRATVEASFPEPLHFSIPNHRTEIVTMLNSAGSKEVSVLERIVHGLHAVAKAMEEAPIARVGNTRQEIDHTRYGFHCF